MARRFFSSYKPPAIDGPRALRNASLTLLNARTLANLTAESLARTHGLKLATAEQMIAAEQQRRRAHG